MKKSINFFMFCLVITLSVCCIASVSQATVVATYAGGGTEQNFDKAIGYSFTPQVDLIVNSLGLYDLGTAGFADSHDVGIFLTDGTPVASTTISSGLSGTLVEGSRFVSVTPFILHAGTHYYILANNFVNDQYAFGTGVVNFASEITWDGYTDGSTNSIFSTATNNLGGEPGDLGPNFQFTTSTPVPTLTEWGMIIFMVLSAIVAVYYLRRKRKSES